MQKSKVLVVEDSMSNREYLVQLLSPFYQVFTADSGEKALRMADKHQPDVILLDIILPGISGYETCQRIRENKKLQQTKVVAISTMFKTDDRLEGYSAGVDDYISKPFNGDELMAKIRVFLRLKSVEEVSFKLKQACKQTMIYLVQLMEAKDVYFRGHSERMSQYAVHLGKFIGLDQQKLNRLKWASLIHDIGRIGMPDDILKKDGPLTYDEYEMIKTHTAIAHKLLNPAEMHEDILSAVKHHHEHYNGKGYPDGLAGEEIPLLARILHVADVWDALTSERAYRPALSCDEARQIIRQEAGRKSDPGLAAQFLEMLHNNPRILSETLNFTR